MGGDAQASSSSDAGDRTIRRFSFSFKTLHSDRGVERFVFLDAVPYGRASRCQAIRGVGAARHVLFFARLTPRFATNKLR
jgi:hypothetical protein